MKTKLTLLIVAVLLMGCQSKKVSSGSSSTTAQSSGSLLGCVKFAGTGNLIRGRVITDPMSGDYVILKFLSSPTAFTSSSASIQIYAGVDIAPTSGVGYVIYDSNLSIAMSGYKDPGTAITYSSLKINNVQNQLTNMAFHLNVGPMARVLRIRLTQGSTVLEDTQLLIPAIDANPNTYASSRPQDLVNLHPLLPYKDSGWSGDQFKMQGEYLCSLP